MDGLRGGASAITIQAQAPPTTQETWAETAPPWASRYHYLPPRQRAGRVLYMARVFKRLTQTKLAAQSGMSRDRLLEMEQGLCAIDPDEAGQLAHILEIEAHLLLTEVGVTS